MKDSIPSNVLSYCEYYMMGNSELCKTGKINMSTICYMQILASVMANESSAYNYLKLFALDGTYGEATISLAAAYMQGITHPHYLQSYYLISKGAVRFD